jgi:hypothetical protein
VEREEGDWEVTYRFDTEYRSDGSCLHRCGEHQHRDARALARLLVESDAPDGPVESGPPGKRHWTTASLHAFAATTLEDGDAGFKNRVWRPYPPREVHPALQDAVSRVDGQRRAAFEARKVAQHQKALTNR